MVVNDLCAEGSSDFFRPDPLRSQLGKTEPDIETMNLSPHVLSLSAPLSLIYPHSYSDWIGREQMSGYLRNWEGGSEVSPCDFVLGEDGGGL